MQNVEETIQPVLLQVIITKLASKAFAITQHKEISTWKILRENLEGKFCATCTPGYLQLELTMTKFQQGETVREYATKQNKQSKGFNNQRNQDIKQVSCIYCKKFGHTIKVSYKKKNADSRKEIQDNPSTSGNAK
ncbi:Zinc finger, CCHC-type [Cinara cedri]|uniref:Zinc finger, CCHC-type n=1 Tax=Cinara cedri TaxID=506608 RepID=A0A5E4MTH4_9HEMI|nr:Zinc finger, CCHC-type [Cinara cedri]